MYFDNRPCDVCGAEVHLRSRDQHTPTEPDGTVDQRVCTNENCPTRRDDGSAGEPAR